MCNELICMTLTDMFLTSNMADVEIYISDYAVLRTDRRHRRQRRVAMYIYEAVTSLIL